MMFSLCLRCVLLLVIAFASNAVVAQQTITIPPTFKNSDKGNTDETLSPEPLHTQWTGSQTLTLSWTFMNGTAIGGFECAADGSVDFINTPDSDTAGSGHSIFITFFGCGNEIDQLDRTFTVKVTANQPVFDTDASNCDSTTDCTITITIEDSAPTTVTVDSATVTLDEGKTLDIPLTLSRRLIDGERIDVPFTIINSTTSDSDYQIRLKSGTNLNRGVTFDSTKISFGQGAKVATLQFRAIHDEMFNESDESVFLTFSTPVANMPPFRESSSFSSPGLNTSKGITIVNNPNASGIRIRSKIFLEGPLR